jgi:hypothetical protein
MGLANTILDVASPWWQSYGNQMSPMLDAEVPLRTGRVVIAVRESPIANKPYEQRLTTGQSRDSGTHFIALQRAKSCEFAFAQRLSHGGPKNG